MAPFPSKYIAAYNGNSTSSSSYGPNDSPLNENLGAFLIKSLTPSSPKITASLCGSNSFNFSSGIVFAKKPVPRSLPIYRPVQPLRKAPEAQQLNVNKIQIFISDLDIESIECPGKEKNIIIKKRSQTMRTEIKLNEKDIGEIINEFSEKARIPIIEGLLKARVGRLQISAVISDEAGSRFIITRRDVQMLGPGPGMVGPRFPRPIQKPLTPPQNRMQQSNQGLQGMQPSIIHR